MRLKPFDAFCLLIFGTAFVCVLAYGWVAFFRMVGVGG